MARADADVISELDLGFSSNPPALWLCARVTPGVALPDVWVVEVGGRAVRVASDGGRAVIDGLIVAATPRVVVARALLDGLGPEVGYAVHVDTPSGRRSFPPGGGKVAAPSAPALTWWTV
jgi:Ethanolamine utilization protein EutJ (predicted chaperonin)